MNVVVLAGGTSMERDVSLSTGSMIYKALKQRGYNTVLLDVYLGSNVSAEDAFTIDKDWAADIGAIDEDVPDIDAVKALRDNPDYYFGPNVIEICRNADIVFLALHGANGEDGKLQAAFDLMGIRYTGSDYTSSVLAMDKSITKEVFAFHKVPTPINIHIRRGEAFSWELFPCMVKVCRGGSSVGVYLAADREEMVKAMDEAFIYDDELVVEQYIKGREFSVGVIDGVALPVIEIAPKSGFYDYKNKYQPGLTVETCPADISNDIAGRMQQIAVDAYNALRIKAYARMDLMMDDNNNLYCLEANTLPGMTPTSLIPQEANVVGIDFGSLCDKIIEVSLKKYK